MYIHKNQRSIIKCLPAWKREYLSSISRRVQFNSKYGLVKKVSTKSAWEGSGDKNQKSEFVCFDAYRRVDWNKISTLDSLLSMKYEYDTGHLFFLKVKSSSNANLTFLLRWCTESHRIKEQIFRKSSAFVFFSISRRF